MATEPQTNPSETDPLLEKYEKFKNKAQAFETAIETKRDQLDIIRKKSGDPFAQDKKRAFSALNEFGDDTSTIQNDFKKYGRDNITISKINFNIKFKFSTQI